MHAVRVCEVPQEVRVIVVGDGARVVDAEGVEEVAEREPGVERLGGALEGKVANRGGGLVLALLRFEEGDIV